MSISQKQPRSYVMEEDDDGDGVSSIGKKRATESTNKRIQEERNIDVRNVSRGNELCRILSRC